TAPTPGHRAGSSLMLILLASLLLIGISVQTCPAACSYTLSGISASFPTAGGAGSVGVTAGSGCAWSVSNTNTWITVTAGASGSGNGTMSYSVAANTVDLNRSGTL